MLFVRPTLNWLKAMLHNGKLGWSCSLGGLKAVKPPECPWASAQHEQAHVLSHSFLVWFVPSKVQN